MRPVSLVELVVNPTGFLDKTVMVMGYFKVDISSRLYLTGEHSSVGDLSSSISVEDRSRGGLKASICNGQWVIIKAKFSNMHESLALREIESIRHASGKFCWKDQ